MKKLHYINGIIFLSLFLWASLIVSVVFKIFIPGDISSFSAKLEIIFNIITVFLVTKIYKNNLNKKELFFLVIASIGLLLNDIVFYFTVYYPANFIINLSSLSFAIDMVSFSIWIIACLLFLSKIFMQDIFKMQQVVKILTGLALVNMIIIVLYLSSIPYAFGALSWESIPQIVSTAAELIIFDLAILSLIYSINHGLSWILSGFIALVAGDCMINYSYLSQTTVVESYGELFWFLGILFIFFGALILQQDKGQVIGWLRKPNAIKSKLGIWAFGISMFSILPPFMWIYFMVPNNQDVFLIFLPLIMTTTVIVVVLSLVTGSHFERPFKKIAQNIKKFMVSGNSEALDSDFSIDEFILLQKFIHDAYVIREERDNVRKAQGELAAQVAHDIRSPIAAILMLAKESVELPEEPRTILRDAAHRIQDIANHLLGQADEVNTNNSTEKDTLFLASTAILSVISEKKVEYKNTQISIIHEFKADTVFCFIQASLTEFKRVISNLINNAIESMDASGRVKVRLSNKADLIYIDIIDAGNGMSPSTIEAVMQGETISNKKSGLGLGLSHARTFLQKCDAQLNITSKTTGTMVSLIFKKQPYSNCWIAHEIKLNSNAIVVILDDDLSIHGAWDSLLSSFFRAEGIALKPVHFTQGLECLNYLKQLQPHEREAVVILADYKLIKQDMNGLDVIERAELPRAILVTSYYDNDEIIKRAAMLNTKILPKTLVSEVKLTVMPEGNNTESKSIDLVLLEDNKVLSEVVAYLYENQGKSLDVYHDAYSLLDNLDRYDKLNTKFCLDYDLGGGVNGIELADILYQRGFRQLYLASGYKFNYTEIPAYLTVLTSKMELIEL